MILMFFSLEKITLIARMNYYGKTIAIYLASFIAELAKTSGNKNIYGRKKYIPICVQQLYGSIKIHWNINI